MKTLLRTTLLAAALMATALAAAGTVTPPGTCYTTCIKNFAITYVQWTATQEECCGGVIPPCPAGYHASLSSYAPYLKPRMVCPPPM